MRIDVYHHIEVTGIQDKFNQVLALLNQLIQRGDVLMKEVDDLAAQVEATTTLESSAIVLINGLADQIKALSADPAALAALSDKLKASASTLAAALAANTPAAPEPAPPVA